MGGQGSQRKFYSHTAKGKPVALVEPRSRKDASESTSAMEHDSVLVHGDFREPPSRSSSRRPFFIRGKVRLFGHFVPLQFLLLALVESLVFAGTTLLTLLSLGTDVGGSQQPLLGMAPKALTIASLLTFSLGALGLYSAHQRADVAGVLSRALVAFVVGLLGLGILYWLVPDIAVDRNILAAAMVGSLVSFGLIRVLFYHYVDGSMLIRRVLVIGTGKRARSIERLRRRSDKRGFKLVGFVNVAPNDGCNHVSSDRVISVGNKFCNYALLHGVDEIVVALDDRRQGMIPTDELLNCRMSGIDVSDMLDFFERETAKIRLDLLRPSWLIHAEGFKYHALREFSKRAFDVTLAAALFILTSPLMLFTAAAICIESGGSGSVFYRQKRVGQDGKTFDLIKFRSMRMDAEKDGKARWATKNDPRVTRVGNFIRKYRLDELPQLWNVLRNDMSIVGPRPERPEFVENLSRLSPLYKERHRVKPGIAGWAQLRYPYGASEQDSIEKLQYDLYYVKNHRLIFDLYILVQTVEVVLYTKGAR